MGMVAANVASAATVSAKCFEKWQHLGAARRAALDVQTVALADDGTATLELPSALFADGGINYSLHVKPNCGYSLGIYRWNGKF